MKKYISPIAKSIHLYGESALLTGSGDPEDSVIDEGTDADALSNRRGGIWGDTEW